MSATRSRGACPERRKPPFRKDMRETNQNQRLGGPMFHRRAAIIALAAAALCPQHANAEANTLRVAKQFGIAYMQFMVMEDQKMIEKHAKAAGLGDITVEFNQFRSSDVMNDALISGSVDFVSLGIPGIITIWSKTKGTPIEVKASSGFNVSPLMLMVRDPSIKSLKDFKPRSE